jgi:hypothetical protein
VHNRPAGRSASGLQSPGSATTKKKKKEEEGPVVVASLLIDLGSMPNCNLISKIPF